LNPNTSPLFNGPTINSRRLKRTDTQAVTLLSEKDGWYKVRLTDHQIAWTPAWLLHSHRKLSEDDHIAGATIVIDAGHGGADAGAMANGSGHDKKNQEKTYTLLIANQLAKVLVQRGARVSMTRDRDHYVSLESRVNLSNQRHADAFISLHLNSSPNENEGSGITTYYYHKGPSKRLAKAVSKQFGPLPGKDLGIEFGDFEVLRDNHQPAILCETGYINSDKDFKLIKKTSFQHKVAQAISRGLNSFLAAK
jgi:N-acetylmuramoyl-L-alanine amidase